MASYETNEVMCAYELLCPECHSTSMQAPLDIVHDLVLAAHFAHRILRKFVPFLCRKLHRLSQGMNFENMWSIHHEHTDIMYVFTSHIHFRGCMNLFSPASG
jgi:hypothetical protein